MSVLSVRDLEVTYRTKVGPMPAVRGVSLDIDTGEVLGLAGESGCGKSTIVNAILRLLPPGTTVGGEVLLNGEDVLTMKPGRLRAVRWTSASVVFQGAMHALNPVQRIGDQLAEAIVIHGQASQREATVRVGALLEQVGLPPRRLRDYPHELSGGQKQRVMIAMALACGPSLVIADEPTTALDVTVQAQVLRLLQRLRSEIGCSIMLITHDLGVAAQISDRIAVLYAGRIAEIGPTAQVLGQPAHPYTHGLLRSRLTLDTARHRKLAALAGAVPSPVDPLPGCAFAPRCVLATTACEATPPDPTTIAPGRVSACIVPFEAVSAELGSRLTTTTEDIEPDTESTETSEPPAVVLHEAVKAFGKLQALRGISLTVAHGESVALVGESGSGKSTLLRVIAGLEKPSSGAVELAGGQRPQMVFQDAGASLTPWLSVGELISERLRGNGMSRSQRQDAVAQVLQRVGLPLEVAKSRAGQLSGGQRQRVSLARATVVPPSVLLCDEPTSALDVSLAASVLNLIGDLRRTLDMSVVFVTHDLSVARVVADRIAVMYLGRIVEIGPADDVINNPVHPYTQALVDSIPDLGRESRVLPGEPASPLSPPTGCAFHPRCPIAIDTCSESQLDVRLEGAPGNLHQVACIERKAS